MKDRLVKRSFGFNTGTLTRDAQRLLGALQNGTFAPAFVDHLSSTFVADFTAQIALVAKLGTDQRSALGTLRALTLTQKQARVDLIRLASVARRAAKLAFSGQPTVLHSAFQVGFTPRESLARQLEIGRNLLVACQKHAAELAPRGWSAASTQRLQTALDVLTGVDLSQSGATHEKVGLTAQRVEAANLLFAQCLVVQNLANLAYPSASASADPLTVEARTAFLLGVFPPRKGATPAVVPPKPVTVLPTVDPVAPIAMAA